MHVQLLSSERGTHANLTKEAHKHEYLGSITYATTHASAHARSHLLAVVSPFLNHEPLLEPPRGFDGGP